MNVRPVGNRVLIEPKKKEQKVGGIIIPDNGNQAQTEGTVKAVGMRVEEIHVGDHVVYDTFRAKPMGVGGEKMVIIEENEITAIINE